MKKDTTKNNFTHQTLWTADNLSVMRGMNSETIDLIYLDPPFNSNANYAAPIGTPAEGAEFKDTWNLTDIDEAWCALANDKNSPHYNPHLYQFLLSVEGFHSKSMMSYLIFMAPRIIEMYRLLKPTGSLYLHCDPTASHYLKLILDLVFGKSNCRNEIIWHRVAGAGKRSQHKSKSYGRNTDTIFFYTKSSESPFHEQMHTLDEDEMKKKFSKIDSNGRRYHTNNSIFCPPGLGPRPNLCYTYKGATNPHPSGWTVSKPKLQELDDNGYIIWREGKNPLRKRYADEYKGSPIGNLWHDIPPAAGSELTGYPTQKPLALLERIIESSSSENDIVFDPFCGCATTLVAAAKLNRQWVGVDISPKAVDLVKQRMVEETTLFSTFDPIVPDTLPRRTDLGKIRPYNHPQNKIDLYGQQKGYCAGCKKHEEDRYLEIDHILPVSRGGTDHYHNLQLLCTQCNKIKGDRTPEYLKNRLKELNIS